MQKPTKALSLKQPWAWAVLHGKDVENRVWYTHHRGPFWIHASAGMTRKYYEETKEFIEARGILIPPMGELLLGGIIGHTSIVKVAPKLDEPELKWHMVQQFGFILRDTTEVPFVPCVGSRRFWYVPEDILEQCQF